MLRLPFSCHRINQLRIVSKNCVSKLTVSTEKILTKDSNVGEKLFSHLRHRFFRREERMDFPEVLQTLLQMHLRILLVRLFMLWVEHY